jgi:hypothetical protein
VTRLEARLASWELTPIGATRSGRRISGLVEMQVIAEWVGDRQHARSPGASWNSGAHTAGPPHPDPFTALVQLLQAADAIRRSSRFVRLVAFLKTSMQAAGPRPGASCRSPAPVSAASPASAR